MHVLIVRLSSMGDMVHTLPALTDAAKAIKGIQFDWAVDQMFAEIPAWHPAVQEVIACPPRRWGLEILHTFTSGALRGFIKKLRQRKYDLVIDVQTEMKSAAVAWLARGLRCGYDIASVREWGAQFAYQKKFRVPKEMHSITRMRRLLAAALGYAFEQTEPDYGIDRARLNPAIGFRKPYLVFVHCTSWTSKDWDEECWRQLAAQSALEGFSILLPWGNEAERKRAERIAGSNNSTVVLPAMTIGEKASVLANADGVIGCDTGLSHIAAALDVPAVSIYGPTDPALIGARGKNQAHIASNFECVKCHQSKCTYPNRTDDKPACLASITPEAVFEQLKKLLSPANV